MTEPFENVILDCVGLLTQTKSGKENLLTAMCTLTRFPELAEENLGFSQKRIKQRYDRKDVLREFIPGYKMMVFLPHSRLRSSTALHRSISCRKTCREVNCVLATPDRRMTSCLFHINMLKRYCERDAAAKVNVPVEWIDSAVALSSTASAET